MLKSALIVAAYNRPENLRQLLSMLSLSNYDGNSVDLVVSIDFSDKQIDVSEVVQKVDWVHGQKKIILQKENLGLKKHILFCGDLSIDYDFIVFFEEDLIVSPYFYRFARESFYAYKDEKKIAGISLYAYERSEYNNLQFSPINIGYDAYFMQFVSSWGQVWTSAQWLSFRQWLSVRDCDSFTDGAPSYVCNWPKKSWKKHFIRYVVENDLYFVFPYVGLSSNPGVAGENHNSIYDLYATNVLLGDKSSFNFPRVFGPGVFYNSSFKLDFSNINFFSERECVGRYIPSAVRDYSRSEEFFRRNPFRSTFYFRVWCFSIVNDLRIIIFKFKNILGL